MRSMRLISKTSSVVPHFYCLFFQKLIFTILHVNFQNYWYVGTFWA